VNFDEFTSARAESKKRKINYKKAQFIQLVTFDCNHAHGNIHLNKIFIILKEMQIQRQKLTTKNIFSRI